MPDSARAHAVAYRRVPSDRPGFVRLETYDGAGLVSVHDVRAECDSDDLPLFVREYHSQHPRAAAPPEPLRLVRGGLR